MRIPNLVSRRALEEADEEIDDIVGEIGPDEKVNETVDCAGAGRGEDS